MQTTVFEREGKQLDIGNKILTISKSKREDNFPGVNKGVSVTFDFAGEGDDKIVHVTRKVAGATTDHRHWTIKAIKNRDAKGLVGFSDFALSLCMTGEQLSNTIFGLMPDD